MPHYLITLKEIYSELFIKNHHKNVNGMETLSEYMNWYFEKAIFRIFCCEHKQKHFARDLENFKSKIPLKVMLAQKKLCEWKYSHINSINHSSVDNTMRFKNYEACKFLSRCKLSASISVNSLVRCRKQRQKWQWEKGFLIFSKILPLRCYTCYCLWNA